VLLGHLAHGIVPGGIYGGLGVAGELMSPTAGLWIGIATALIGASVPLFLYYKTETDYSIFEIYIVKMVWATLVGIGALYVTQLADYTFRFSLISMAITFSFVVFPAVICFQKRKLDSRGVLKPSKIEPILFSYRGIPNFLSVVVAMFLTIMPAEVFIVKPLDGSEKETVIDGITVSGKHRDLDVEKELNSTWIFFLIFCSYLVSLLGSFLIAEQLGKKSVVYAISVGIGLTLGFQPLINFILSAMVGIIAGVIVGAYIERLDVERISGINLHDKVQVFGDLKNAEAKATRVLVQQEQHRQAMLIHKALEDQRPICLPGEQVTIEEFGDPQDPDYIAPLELPPIATVTSIVQQKLVEEEDIAKELKANQAAVAFTFAHNMKAMQEDSKLNSGKLESLSSIGAPGSANPLRSLLDSKKSITAAQKFQDQTRLKHQTDQALDTLIAIEGGTAVPRLALDGIPEDSQDMILVDGQIQGANDRGISPVRDEETELIPATDPNSTVREQSVGTDPDSKQQGQVSIMPEGNNPYVYDESYEMWFDPQSGFFWHHEDQCWVAPADVQPLENVTPPVKVSALSLRGRADHIKAQNAKKMAKASGKR